MHPAVAADLLGMLLKVVESLEGPQLEDTHEGVVSVLYWLQGVRGAQPKLYLREGCVPLQMAYFSWTGRIRSALMFL